MKTSKKTGKSGGTSKPKSGASTPAKGRKMEPLKSKELKNQRFADDVEDEEELDPEVLDENFKGFDDFFEETEEDED